MKIDNLVFDKEIECFDATLQFDNKSFDITLSNFEPTEEKQAEELANKIGGWMEQNLARTKEYAASKLVQLKNESWLSEGEVPATIQTLIDAMELDGINAFPDGNFEIYFDDNDLFGEHSIVVDVSAAFEFTDVYIGG